MGIDKLILKFIWKDQTQKSQHNIEREEQSRGPMLPDFSIYCKATGERIDQKRKKEKNQ